MGLRDALKSLRREPAETEEPAGEDVVSTPFRPRTDGFFVGTPADGAQAPVRYLRFTITGKVSEIAEVADEEQAFALLSQVGGEINRGDYTPVGSFLVQRRFERPVIYTVLESGENEFTARCTAAGEGRTGEYLFAYRSAPATEA